MAAHWMQAAAADVKARGTEGKCSGSNFGGPGCPEGSRQYNLAVQFKKAARRKHAAAAFHKGLSGQ